MTFFLLFVALLQSPAHAYTGTRSSEAQLDFTAFLDVSYSIKPTISEATDLVFEQVDFMFGPMSLAKYMAAPKGGEDETVTILEINPTDTGYRIKYRYKGIIVVQSGPTVNYPVALPYNPDELYETTAKLDPNPCTDEHYQTKGDFWYFWSPARPGCSKLISPNVDYQVVTAKLKRIKNTKSSRPEYERLPDAKGEIHIFLLMGMDDGSKSVDPITSENTKDDDLNALNFRKIRKKLLSKDFGFESRVWTHEEIKEVVSIDTRPLPYVEDFEKAFNGVRAMKIRVTMFFGKSGWDENSKGFHYFLKEAVKTGAVMIYDGHSGLGSNLFLPAIERDRKYEDPEFNLFPPKARYQIFYFNSCSSYSYYNKLFFTRKHYAGDPKGTKNLDIITTGLETAFDGSVGTNMGLITAIYNWAERGTLTGYKTLIERLENDNLAGVNGDEDNPKTK